MTCTVDADFDVIVVGGGPAGAATATLLSRARHRVLLLERRCLPQDKVCGAYLSPRAVRTLTELDLQTALDLVPQRSVRGIAIHSPGGHRVQGSFGDASGRSIARGDLDHALVRGAQAAGACVVEGARVTDVRREATGVSVAWVRGGGDQRARASLVVGADGRFSTVAERLHLARSSRADRRAVIHGHFARSGAEHDRVDMFLLPRRRYLGLNQLPDGSLNASLVIDLVDLNAAPRAEPVAILRATIAGSRALKSALCSPLVEPPAVLAPLRVKPAARFADRVLLVGDAGGFRDPLTGEGIDAALRGAEMAARCCAAALAARRFDPIMLASYDRDYRRAFRAKDALNAALQWLLAWPGWQDALGERLQRAPDAADRLMRVIGNQCSPWTLLQPDFLRALLRPC